MFTMVMVFLQVLTLCHQANLSFSLEFGFVNGLSVTSIFYKRRGWGKSMAIFYQMMPLIENQKGGWPIQYLLKYRIGNIFMPMGKIITRQMDSYYRATLVVLFSIATVGLIAIPFGNPKFIDRAVVLELSFVTLFVLLWRGYSKALFACIPLASVIIVGNSLAPPHVNLMMTFSKPLNAVILVVGGYVLQGALIYTSLRSLLNMRSRRVAASA